MITSRLILLVILSLQLSTGVLSSDNVTEDARLALILLSDQIESSTTLVSETIPQLWNSSTTAINETIRQGLTNEAEKFTALLHNLTQFANIVTGGTDCVSGFSDVRSYVEDIDVDMVTNEKIVFNNLFSLANVEIDYVRTLFKEVETDFNESCGANWNNCNGTSTFVVAEVERLMPIARRIPYDLLAETHLLGYRLEADWATTAASVNIEYHQVIQSITTCLAIKFENYRTDAFETNLEVPEEVGTITDAYMKLVTIAQHTFSASQYALLYDSSNIVTVGKEIYESTVVDIQNAISKANKTVYSLVNFAEDLNVTTDCLLDVFYNIPDLNDILSLSTTRGLEEYSDYYDAVTIRYEEGFHYLRATVQEVNNIEFQVLRCYQDVNCSTISDKLSKKMTEIPSLLQGRGNGTAVLQYQFITAIRESGSKIVMDALDQLAAPLVQLKDCVRSFLYVEN